MSKKITIVGGGPGGYIAAIRAAQLGAQVTLIEKDRLGGTCLNVGCIPTKCLLHTAKLSEDIRHQSAQIGIDISGVQLNLSKTMAHKNAVARQLVNGVSGLMRANHIQVIAGKAHFVAPGKMQVQTADGQRQAIDADAIVLATGSVNAVPPIPGIKESSHCMDSTGVLALEQLPKTMIVIGAGVIGLEIACAYAAFGTKITVVEALDHVLLMLDGDVTAVGLRHMKRMGITFQMASPVRLVEDMDNGARVLCQNPAGEHVAFEAEKVLVAVGRKANTAALNLNLGGVANEAGKIIVNDHMQTNIKSIYAIGDCVKGHAQLAHAASRMGEIAAENIMGLNTIYDESTNPTCVYMEPEAAAVGLREGQLKAGSYKVGTFPMIANGKALIVNGGEGLIKIIADTKTEKIIGIHMIGPRATDLIAEGAVAIRMGMKVDELTETIHSHPTISEAVREAALSVQGRTLNMPPIK